MTSILCPTAANAWVIKFRLPCQHFVHLQRGQGMRQLIDPLKKQHLSFIDS